MMNADENLNIEIESLCQSLDRQHQLSKINAEMLAVLEECDEAMAYMSEYDIPLCLPDRVKAVIKKANRALATYGIHLSDEWIRSLPKIERQK